MNATAPAQTGPTMHDALRMELDVTPRWYAPGPGFFDDAADIHRVLRDHGGPLTAFLVEVSCGVTGVRIVVGVQAGPSTNAFEAVRLELKAALDALDAVSPRRAKVTAQRAAAEAKPIEAATQSSQSDETAPPDAAPAVPTNQS